MSTRASYSTAYAPLPAVCGSGLGSDPALLSAECGAAMLPMCALASASTTPTEPFLRSAMSDPASSCGLWNSAIVTDRWARAQLGDTLSLASPGATFTDQAISSWCQAFPSAVDCSCESFPYLAQNWCKAQQPCGIAPDLCGATEFQQQSSDPGSTDLEVVQFNTCAPYPCWVAGCRGDGSVLMRTDLFETQMNQCPTGLCVQETDGATISANVPAMPPGSFVLNPTLMQCASQGVSRPAMLVMAPLNVSLPQNSNMLAPTVVTNDGDQLIVGWRVTDYGVAPGVPQWLEFQPSYGSFIAGLSTQLVTVAFDPDVVSGAVNNTWKTIVTVEYDSLGGSNGVVTQTMTATVTLNVGPATQPVLVQQSHFPTSFAIGSGAMGGLAALLLGLSVANVI